MQTTTDERQHEHEMKRALGDLEKEIKEKKKSVKEKEVKIPWWKKIFKGK